MFTEDDQNLESTIVLSEDPSEKMVSICAWCDKDKSVTDHYNTKGYTVSHGLCPACLEEQLAQLDNI